MYIDVHESESETLYTLTNTDNNNKKNYNSSQKERLLFILFWPVESKSVLCGRIWKTRQIQNNNIYIYMYMHICVHVYVYMYVYLYICTYYALIFLYSQSIFDFFHYLLYLVYSVIGLIP